jgi:hypothetical protein
LKATPRQLRASTCHQVDASTRRPQGSPDELWPVALKFTQR